MSLFFASYGNVIDLVLLNSILGLSVYIVLNANMLSLATGGFMAVGAYTGALLTLHADLPFGLTLAAGIAAGTVAAFLLGLPVVKLRGDYLALASLAFGEVVRVVALNWVGLTGGALGLSNIPRLTRTWHLALCLILLVALFTGLKRSHLGRALEAMRLDETAAGSLGIDVFRYRMSAFVASGAIAGGAGVLAAHLNYFVAPNDFGLIRSVDALAYPILGGFGTVAGPIVGAAIFTILPEVFRFSTQLRDIFTGLLLLLAVLYVPRGVATLSLPALLRRRRTRARATASEGGARDVEREEAG